jgi:hypothetical protein
MLREWSLGASLLQESYELINYLWPGAGLIEN